MTTAGRILIIPKGDYDASKSYEMLDLVRYGGTSWICKQACSGKEPTTANADYWQNMFDAEALIDARIEAKIAEYMEKNK
jgi:hypothetical protein